MLTMQTTNYRSNAATESLNLTTPGIACALPSSNYDPIKLQKIAQIESIRIFYPTFKELLDQIEYCRIHSKVSAEPLCMLVTGLTGSGKTTLLESYVDEASQRKIRVLLVRAPPRGTEKKLVSAMLKSIGDPSPESGSVIVQTIRLLNLMDDLNIELVFIDEFQQFVDRDNVHVLQNQCDWVKDLIDSSKRKRGFVFAGMPWAANILRKPENEQLSRRIPIRLEIIPFGWRGEEHSMAFRAFLKMLETQLPLSERSQLANSSTAFRIFCATNGRVGKVMNLVRRAAELAVLNEASCIDLTMLRTAYNDRLRAEHPNRVNPFDTDVESLRPVPFEEYVPNLDQPGRGRKRQERASQILKK
jgi:type II secretory pathway predicted ATPase ExeA